MCSRNCCWRFPSVFSTNWASCAPGSWNVRPAPRKTPRPSSAAHTVSMTALRLLLLMFLLAASLGWSEAKAPLAPQEGDLTEGWRAYVASDYERARALFRDAAERNHALAQFNLSVM